jgi:uncharacterized membrane protein YkvA (DUF1232 family)
MKNPFYKIALAQAARLAGKPGRILQLVAQLTHRLYRMDRTNFNVAKLKEQFGVLSRMMTSYAGGRYKAVPLKTVLTILAAILYFLNPFDLVPDAIFGFGFADDLAVLTWVYRASLQEVDKFIQWEKSITLVVV